MSEPFADFGARCREVQPVAFVVLGSGLGVVAQRVAAIASLGFSNIPGLSASGVSGHRGQWTLGHWAGVPVIVSEGRIHYYEGHSWEVVVRPIDQAARLGVRTVLLTNAAGGIRADLGPGCLMPLRDHLEWNHPNPWRDPPHVPPYSPDLVVKICEAGKSQGLNLIPGIYAAVTGPSYETPAEIRALQSVGADAVGMSTTREAIAAQRHGLACAAISMVTNRAAGLAQGRLDHQEVLATGRAAACSLASLLEELLQRLGDLPPMA